MEQICHKLPAHHPKLLHKFNATPDTPKSRVVHKAFRQVIGRSVRLPRLEKAIHVGC